MNFNVPQVKGRIRKKYCKHSFMMQSTDTTTTLNGNFGTNHFEKNIWHLGLLDSNVSNRSCKYGLRF